MNSEEQAAHKAANEAMAGMVPSLDRLKPFMAKAEKMAAHSDYYISLEIRGKFYCAVIAKKSSLASIEDLGGINVHTQHESDDHHMIQSRSPEEIEQWLETMYTELGIQPVKSDNQQ